MHEITERGTVIARVIRASDWKEGLSFYSKDNEFIQAGTWRYNAGKELLAHRHNPVERTATVTQEVVYVKHGRLAARIYGADRQLLETVELKAGDTLIALHGGHGYDILEDDTQVLEVKNGPYPGPERDRTRF